MNPLEAWYQLQQAVAARRFGDASIIAQGLIDWRKGRGHQSPEIPAVVWKWGALDGFVAILDALFIEPESEDATS